MSSSYTFGTPSKVHTYSSQAEEVKHLTSSHKQQKIFIDRFGGIHREYLKHVANFVPFVKVSAAPERLPSMGESKKENQKAELKELEEMIEKRHFELNSEECEGMRKKQRICKLIEQITARKREGDELRCLAKISNELKMNAWRQKERNQNLISDIGFEAQSVNLLQEREAIIIAREFFMKNKEIGQISEQIRSLRNKTEKVRQEEEVLDEKIEEESAVSQGKTSIINKLKEEINEAEGQIRASGIEVSVLKMQYNPRLRVSFSTVSLDPEGDRKRILDKNANIWSKNKVKTISSSQIRDFFVIQLYPSWKRLLSKISSSFVGYQQLLCYGKCEGEEKMANLALYLPQKSQRNTVGKGRTFIVFYSPIPEKRKEIVDILVNLTGLSNDIIKIGEIKIQELEGGNQQIQINYNYLETPKIKKIQLVFLQQLSKDLVVKSMKSFGEGSVVLFKLEVPLIPGSYMEKIQYELAFDYVYNLLKKK